jgi:hypothetical protein
VINNLNTASLPTFTMFQGSGTSNETGNNKPSAPTTGQSAGETGDDKKQ